MTSDQAKGLAALILFFTWVGLIAFKVQGAEDLISGIKYTLTALAAHYLTNFQSDPPPPKVDVPAGQATLKE